MATVGLRALREQASELVRRAEAGEEITITVAGRPVARLVAGEARNWRRWRDVADLFEGPGDHSWDTDRARVDGTPANPYEPPDVVPV